jgi:hypothetical protein
MWHCFCNCLPFNKNVNQIIFSYLESDQWVQTISERYNPNFSALSKREHESLAFLHSERIRDALTFLKDLNISNRLKLYRWIFTRSSAGHRKRKAKRNSLYSLHLKNKVFEKFVLSASRGCHFFLTLREYPNAMEYDKITPHDHPRFDRRSHPMYFYHQLRHKAQNRLIKWANEGQNQLRFSL